MNGEPIHRHALRDGDVIQIGHFRLRYCQPAGVERPTMDQQSSDQSETQILGPRALAS